MSMGILEYKFRVDYRDVDEFNHLTPRSMLRFMGEAAGEASASVGYGLNDIPRTHLTWLLLNWKLQIFDRPIWETELKIKTWPQRTEKFYSFRDFEIYDGDGILVAKATSKWILINTETGSITRFSQEMIDAYGCIDKTVFDKPIEEKLKEPESFVSEFQYAIQRRDIDTNHHVNNLYYLDFAFEALPDDVYKNIDISTIEIMYKKQLVYGDHISCLYKKTGEKEHTITIKDNTHKTLHAIIRFTEK